MIYKFHAYGHANIRGTHKTTLEFTKDREVSLRGDCIVGIKADFELDKIRNFIKQLKGNKISIAIKTPKIQEKTDAQINPEFDDDRELVIRKTNFISKRTFATSSNKAAFDLKKDLLAFLGKKGNKVTIVVENK